MGRTPECHGETQRKPSPRLLQSGLRTSVVLVMPLHSPALTRSSVILVHADVSPIIVPTLGGGDALTQLRRRSGVVLVTPTRSPALARSSSMPKCLPVPESIANARLGLVQTDPPMLSPAPVKGWRKSQTCTQGRLFLVIYGRACNRGYG
jgi:hypothetical protein